VYGILSLSSFTLRSNLTTSGLHCCFRLCTLCSCHRISKILIAVETSWLGCVTLLDICCFNRCYSQIWYECQLFIWFMTYEIKVMNFHFWGF
jgi:hypothetical protein